MSSPQATGTLALSFSEPVILHIATNMLGEPFTEINDEIADLVGELTNMVTGGAKKLLESKGYDFDMATPTVIRGKAQKITHTPGASAVIIVPLRRDDETLTLQSPLRGALPDRVHDGPGYEPYPEPARAKQAVPWH